MSVLTGTIGATAPMCMHVASQWAGNLYSPVAAQIYQIPYPVPMLGRQEVKLTKIKSGGV